MQIISTHSASILAIGLTGWGMLLPSADPPAQPTASTVAEDQTIIPPPGDYRLVDLVMEKAAAAAPQAGQWGVPYVMTWGADIHLVAGIRDAKIRGPSRLSVRDIISQLEVTAESIQGTYVYQAKNSFTEESFVIKAAIANGRITGTWEATAKKTAGSVSGFVKSETDLQRENAFRTKADWPCWSGPLTGLAAAPCALRLVDDFNKDARLVWRSEDLVPQGPGSALNYEAMAASNRTNGGGSSLIVSDGKVFASYYQPAGSDLMKTTCYLKGEAGFTSGPPDAMLDFLAKKLSFTVSPFMTEKFLRKADDVVVGMDASTGKTLWKNVFAGKSLNQPSHKGGCVNNTPCAGGGRIFAMGPSGCLHGIDIATGKVLWERTGLSAEGVVPWSGARNQCTAPISAGDTLILPDHGSAVRGIDPATGKDRWKLEGKSCKFQVPAKWVHDGKDLVLSLSDGAGKGAPAQVHCIEPATGAVLWSLDLGTSPSKGVTVCGDTLTAFINLESTAVSGSVATTANATCVAYRLTPAKAEPLWRAACPYVSLHSLPASNGTFVVLGGQKESRLLDATTGKELAAYTGPGPYNEGHVMLCEDRAFLSLDGSHGSSAMVVLGLSPDLFAKALGTWDQPHPQTTSYHNKHMTFPTVEGRIFFRGLDGVYCYDLRKP